MDETERRILALLRDLEEVPSADPEITSNAGFIHLRRDGVVLATDIPTGAALDRPPRPRLDRRTGHGHFRITSAGLRAIGARR
ncbi:MAG: hypothetical protein U0232_22550 [Thermomicrobiales bacterium]